MTMLGAVSPAITLTFEACGRGAPFGQAVTKVDAVGPVAVRLNATAVADAGTLPVRSTEIVPPWPTGGTSVGLVSRSRDGSSGVNRAPAAVE
jgi:hypothetical protein